MAPGFEPCTYQVEKQFQKLPFKFDLHRYRLALRARARLAAARAAGALQPSLTS
jgi:hypothetical protein